VLADAFCRVLGQTFGDPSPPPDSWWTTDYHLDWLAGASLWRKEHPCEIHVGRVTGTIGDVDIIVAAPDYLYLIEAKAAGSWNNGQLIRKVKLLDGFWMRSAREGALPFHPLVRVFVYGSAFCQ